MVKEIVNRIIVSFEDTLTIYEDNPVEIKIKLLDSKLRKIIEENPDIDLFDYFCEFYNKENNLKEIESFLDISKFVYDGTSLEQRIKERINNENNLMELEILLDDCRIASDLNLEEITQKIIDYKNSISNRNNNNILKNRITYEFLTKYIDETKR